MCTLVMLLYTSISTSSCPHLVSDSREGETGREGRLRKEEEEEV